MKKIFKTTAIIKSEYMFFGIHEKIACLYGVSKKDILYIEFKISADQTIRNNLHHPDPDYWGWLDYEKDRFTMIHAKRGLLNMCFAYGIDASEKLNRGKAYRIKILN